jgi:hypothetical protein
MACTYTTNEQGKIRQAQLKLAADSSNCLQALRNPVAVLASKAATCYGQRMPLDAVSFPRNFQGLTSPGVCDKLSLFVTTLIHADYCLARRCIP